MRLVTLDSREVGGRPGAWLPTGEILDLVATPGSLASTQWLPQSVVSVLAQGEEGMEWVARLAADMDATGPEDRRELREAGRLLPYPGTALLAPVRRPGLLLITRVAGSLDKPTGISGYVKNPNAAVGPEAVVASPAGEGARLELIPCLGLVLGRPLFRASPATAARAIAAYTILVDLGMTGDSSGAALEGAARQFPGAAPIGPAVITPDEFNPRQPLQMNLRINGHPVAQTAWAADAAAYGEVVARISATYALRPGDIIALAAPEAPARAGIGERVAVTLGAAMTLNFSLGR